MNKLDKYDGQSERLSDDCTFEQRMDKYGKILMMLNSVGIQLVEAVPNPVLEDTSCGFRMIHNKITWDVFRVVDVFDMIHEARESHKEETDEE